MKVRFETFGCRLNRAEALETEAAFLAAGWELTQHRSDADLIIVRGCSVTGRAQKECEALLAHLARKYPAKRVVATGCLAAKKNEYLLDPLRAAGAAPAAPEGAGRPPVPDRTARAWLKVQDGCDSRCAFCIVPQFRGNSVSEPFDKVVDKAKRFIDAGYGEIVVTGCNIAQYSSNGRFLGDLASALASLGGCRFRFGSVEPGRAAADLVRVMAENSNICRFLHLSVQSASNNMLAAMRRPYKNGDILALVADAIHAMPDIALGCDIIAGFPGETEGDHLSTRAMLERQPFSNVHVFPYSERPGTAALKLGNAVPRAVRSARARELAGIAAAMRKRYAARFKSKTVEIIVEDAAKTAGWTGEYLWCEAADASLKTGGARPSRKALVAMKVMGVSGDKLKGATV